VQPLSVPGRVGQRASWVSVWRSASGTSSASAGRCSTNETKTNAEKGSPPAQTEQLRPPDTARGEQHQGGQHEIRALR
jgi:hypothetical protein